MGVARFTVAPGRDHLSRVVDHDPAVRPDAPAVERRLNELALPAPELAFAGDQPLAHDGLQRDVILRFEVVPEIGDEHGLDVFGPADEAHRYVKDPEKRDVAIVFREAGQEAEPVSRSPA